MKKFLMIFSVVVLMFGMVAQEKAEATFIDFDDTSASCLFNQSTPLTDMYAPLGVTWDGGGAILNECGNFGVTGHSSPNFLA